MEKQGKEIADGWLKCPVCHKKVMRLLPTTVAKDLIVYCRRCRRESVLDISNSETFRIIADTHTEIKS